MLEGACGTGRVAWALALVRVLREEREILRLRWCFRDELRHLFELTGFEVEAEHSDFRGSRPAYGKEQVWVLRKAT